MMIWNLKGVVDLNLKNKTDKQLIYLPVDQSHACTWLQWWWRNRDCTSLHMCSDLVEKNRLDSIELAIHGTHHYWHPAAVYHAQKEEKRKMLLLIQFDFINLKFCVFNWWSQIDLHSDLFKRKEKEKRVWCIKIERRKKVKSQTTQFVIHHAEPFSVLFCFACFCLTDSKSNDWMNQRKMNLNCLKKKKEIFSSPK